MQRIVDEAKRKEDEAKRKENQSVKAITEELKELKDQRQVSTSTQGNMRICSHEHNVSRANFTASRRGMTSRWPARCQRGVTGLRDLRGRGLKNLHHPLDKLRGSNVLHHPYTTQQVSSSSCNNSSYNNISSGNNNNNNNNNNTYCGAGDVPELFGGLIKSESCRLIFSE